MEKELTFGMKAVGINFNPSGDEKIIKAKQLCAELIDLVEETHKLKQSPTWIVNVFKTAAFNLIIQTQMQVVKYLAWKD
jgi:hypothetical protein